MPRSRVRVVADTCVLYPPSFRDILVQLAINDQIQLVIPDLVLVELTGALVRSRKLSDAQVQSVINRLAQNFEVVADLGEHSSADEAILKVANFSGADLLVTQNIKDFRQNSKVAVRTMDQFLVEQELRVSNSVRTAVEMVVSRWRTPRVEFSAHILHLRKMGLHEICDLIEG